MNQESTDLSAIRRRWLESHTSARQRILHAPEDVAALLGRVEQLEAALRRVVAVCDPMECQGNSIAQAALASTEPGTP